ncbi:MAG: M56 family metallopeptidase, partial [Bacteroidota bacterium]
MLPLLVKSSLIIIVMVSFYKLLLEKESFFATNRAYLLSCLLFAGLLPFITLPKLIEHQGIISSFFAADYPTSPSTQYAIQERKTATPIDTAILESVDTLAIHSIAEGQTIPLAEDSASAESSEIIPSSTTSSKRGLGFWLLLLYLFGVAVLGVNLLFQIVGVLWKAYRNEDKIEDDGVVIVNIQGEAEPCSFFRYIFINPSLYDFDTYEQILTHERIHVEKGHSLDLLLAELAVVFLWFNPFVWILRKEVEKNLEYQTDHLLIANAEEVKESYQINLVKMATYTQPLNITTNYNQSLITQRILK